MIKNIFIIVLALLVATAMIVIVVKHNKAKKLQEEVKKLSGRIAEEIPEDEEKEESLNVA